MITGKLPYPDIDDIDNLKCAISSLKQVIPPKEVSKLPNGFKKALGAMLQLDPELRPTIEQVLLLISEADAPGVKNIKKNNQKRLSLPNFSSASKASIPSNHKSPSIRITDNLLDENTRISLALLMVN